MKKRILFMTILLILIPLLFTSCAPGDGTSNSANPAGFFWGLWHGCISLVTLIIGLFNKNIRIYEVYNNGWWYDFGFIIAVISGLGSTSWIAGKRKK